MGDTRHFNFDMIPSIVYVLGSQFSINGIDYQMSPGLHVHKYVVLKKVWYYPQKGVWSYQY